ncbi:MAG: diguanylate cyclase domain protein [Proteobacteria bacterium]|nr:diguanylate cyclase domain protein [Pseudomonadota bacterium]
MRLFPSSTRLGSRLMWRILLLSIVFWVAITICFGMLAWRKEISAQEARLNEIRDNAVTQLANDLWEFDETRIKLQLEIIQRMLPGSSIKLNVVNGSEYLNGANLPANPAKAHRFELRHPKSTKILGVLTVIPDSSPAMARVRQTLENDALLQIGLIVLLVLTLSYFVNRLVVRRVAELGHFARSLDLTSLDNPKNKPLPVSSGHSPDEIDDLADALNGMRQRLIDDVAANRSLHAELARKALQDPLTALGNRAQLSAQARTLFSEHADCEAAFVFIDIDRLKLINNTLGHMIGDHLLRAMAERMKSIMPERVTLFRPGSDEFLLLIPEPRKSPGVEEIVHRLQDVMSKAFEIEKHLIPITVTIGAAIAPEHGRDISTLLKHANIALQAAKRQGRGSSCFFNPDLLATLNERVQLETLLRGALERYEFEVYYQPQIEIRNGKLSGAEALLRWRNTEMGFVGPDRFIPVAEDCGLIVAIGAWVLRTACQEGRRWLDAGLDLTLSVNLSSIQLRHAGLTETIRAAIDDSGLPGHLLEVEITESIIMDDVKQASACLQSLRDLGVHVAIDDFGTGYSSMAYLKHLPIDRLKIDRAFITDIPGDLNDTAIAIAVIRLAEALNLEVIAEGVESIEQAELLQQQGCPSAQGFFYARPMPAGQFLDFALKNAGITPFPDQS